MPFDAFHRALGPGDKYRDLDDEAIERLSARLPAELMELLRSDGLCRYGGQLFFTVDDKDFEPARLAWVPNVPDATIFGRTALGTLYLWVPEEEAGGVHVLMPHIGRVSLLGTDITWFFDGTLTDKVYIDDGLLRGWTAKAEQHAGRLEWDEMYGYEPALALGGRGRVEAIRRFKMNEHQLLLSQLQELQEL